MSSLNTLIHRYQALILLSILAFAFFTRVYRVHIPEGYYFDEVYHAVTAKLIAANDPRAFEWWNPAPEPNTAVDWLHPPLAKYTQALSIIAFGENSFGWRFSSVVFGVLVVLCTYWLTREVTGSIPIALLSSFLASLDGLLLVQSRIAMNDIHVTFFILLTLLVYHRARTQNNQGIFLLATVCSGLAVATKWSGFFVIVFIFCFELLRCVLSCFALYQKHKNTHNALLRQVLLLASRVILLVVVPLSIYVASYSVAFLQGKDFKHFLDLHHQIFYYQFHLDETHPSQSRPWQWFLNTNPVWQYVNYSTADPDAAYFPSQNLRADIFALGNPLLFWIGDTALLITVFQILKKLWQKGVTKGMRYLQTDPVVYLLAAYCIVWLPWIFSPRIMFFYHYTPAVPLLCIILALQLSSLWKKNRAAVLGLLAAICVTFILFFPHWTALPVPASFVKNFYFAFSSWK